MCGTCMEGYFLNKASRSCAPCSFDGVLDSVLTVLIMAALAFALYLVLTSGGLPVPERLRDRGWPDRIPVPGAGALMAIDKGALKVLWVTFQIITSISGSLDFAYPEPFYGFLESLAFVQINFVSIDCVEKRNYHDEVLVTSVLPMLMCGAVGLRYLAKVVLNPTVTAEQRKVSFSRHAGIVLLITYLVLPKVSTVQFQGLNCLHLVSGEAYLKADTSIDCNSPGHQSFVQINAVLILIYQAIPIGYLWVLLRNHKRLKPPSAANDEVAIQMRDRDGELDPIRFLFQDLSVGGWFHEVVDMYRRIAFVGVLPLIGPDITVRCYVGVALAMLSAVYFREVTPYRTPSTNLLACIAQYQILTVFVAVLLINGNSLALLGVTPFGVGVALVLVNSLILVLAFAAGQRQHMLDELEKERKKRKVRIEWAANFTPTKFQTTLDSVAETSVAESHVLVYHYTSLAAAREMATRGVPAMASTKGVVVSMLGPQAIAPGDACLAKMGPLSASREAVVCIRLPRTLVFPLDAPATAATGGVSLASLMVLPVAVLSALAPEETERDKKVRQNLYRLKRMSEVRSARRAGSTSGVVAAASGPPPSGADAGADAAAEDAELGHGGRASVAVKRHAGTFLRARGGEVEHAPHDPPIVLPLGCVLRIYQLEDDGACTARGLHDFDLDHSHAPRLSASAVAPGASVVEAAPPAGEDVSGGSGGSGRSGAGHSRLRSLKAAAKVAVAENRQAAQRASGAHGGLADSAAVVVAANTLAPRSSAPPTAPVRRLVEVEAPESVLALCARLARARDECAALGFVAVFHYTNLAVAPLIAKGGLRMSTQGQGDGGVYFSTLSPASYGVGTEGYERAIIEDCFGTERIHEYLGKHKLDVCLVYGVCPRVLQPAPGGRANARMVHRSLFEALGTPDVHTGDHFLRGDRLVAAIDLNPTRPLALDAKNDAFELEHCVSCDQETVHALDMAWREMQNNVKRSRGLGFGGLFFSNVISVDEVDSDYAGSVVSSSPAKAGTGTVLARPAARPIARPLARRNQAGRFDSADAAATATTPRTFKAEAHAAFDDHHEDQVKAAMKAAVREQRQLEKSAKAEEQQRLKNDERKRRERLKALSPEEQRAATEAQRQAAKEEGAALRASKREDPDAHRLALERAKSVNVVAAKKKALDLERSVREKHIVEKRAADEALHDGRLRDLERAAAAAVAAAKQKSEAKALKLELAQLHREAEAAAAAAEGTDDHHVSKFAASIHQHDLQRQIQVERKHTDSVMKAHAAHEAALTAIEDSALVHAAACEWAARKQRELDADHAAAFSELQRVENERLAALEAKFKARKSAAEAKESKRREATQAAAKAAEDSAAERARSVATARAALERFAEHGVDLDPALVRALKGGPLGPKAAAMQASRQADAAAAGRSSKKAEARARAIADI